MKFSLINVTKQTGNLVDGAWLQNHIGTLETASKRARETEESNSNKIIVAVVDDLGYSEPNYSGRIGLKRLDISNEIIIKEILRFEKLSDDIVIELDFDRNAETYKKMWVVHVRAKNRHYKLRIKKLSDAKYLGTFLGLLFEKLCFDEYSDDDIKATVKVRKEYALYKLGKLSKNHFNRFDEYSDGF